MTGHTFKDIGIKDCKIAPTLIDIDYAYEYYFFNNFANLELVKFNFNEKINTELLQLDNNIGGIKKELEYIELNLTIKKFNLDAYNVLNDTSGYFQLILITENTRYTFYKCKMADNFNAKFDNLTTNIEVKVKAIKTKLDNDFYKIQTPAYGLVPQTPINEISGININPSVFTYAFMDKIVELKIKYVRVDLPWHEIETVAGVYDFTTAGWDLVHAALIARGLTPIYILAYGNPLYTTYYGSVTSLQTQAEIDAFIDYAEACVNRYKADGALFEFWNEVNHEYFWLPQPSNDKYIEALKQVYTAIKAIDVDIKVLAPAVDNLDTPYAFLKDCIDNDLLSYCDYISCHPYRNNVPSTAISDYWAVYNYIQSSYPDNRDKKIACSEWGYPSDVVGEAVQAAWVCRMYLIEAYFKIPISILYELKDSAPYDYFGLLQDQSSPIVEKQAFIKLKEMMTELEGYWFVKRLDSDSNDALLLFSDGNNYKIAFFGDEDLTYEIYTGVFVEKGVVPDFLSISLDCLIQHFNYI
jgi:hypothetical protein